MSHSGHCLSQDSNPGLCMGWIIFSLERVSGNGSMVGLGGGPREGGRAGRCVTPLEFHLSLCLSVSLFISLDSSVSVFVLSLSVCFSLSVSLPPLCI